MIYRFVFALLSGAVACFAQRPEPTTGAGALTRPAILWAVATSPKGDRYAVGGNDGGLRIYDAQTHAVLQRFQFPSAVQVLDYHPDGTWLAVGLDARPVQLLDVGTGTFRPLPGSTGSRALDWSPDGNRVAVGDYAKTLQIWSKSGTLIRTIPAGDNKSYLSVEWHPTKDVLLTGSDQIRIYDGAGHLLRAVKHRPESTPVLTVRWHPSGRFFATGDYGEPENQIPTLLQYWDENGVLIRTMTGSQAEYRTLRWSQSGERLASASDALRIWSTDGQLLHSGPSEAPLWGLAWDAADRALITGSRDGKIKLWTKDAAPLRTAGW
jgi:WD40 repeat protein